MALDRSRDDDGDDHHRYVLGHTDGRDDGVQREHEVEQQDLKQHVAERDRAYLAAVLAAVLIVVGLRLISLAQIRTYARHRELPTYLITALGVAFTDLLTGEALYETTPWLSTLPEPAVDALDAALATGEEILADGGSSLDAVEAVIRLMEDDPLFNAGCGSVLNEFGRVEMDAGIMDGDLVAVHRTPEARSGQIVVARLDDEVTVKRYRQALRFVEAR